MGRGGGVEKAEGTAPGAADLGVQRCEAMGLCGALGLGLLLAAVSGTAAGECGRTGTPPRP